MVISLKSLCERDTNVGNVSSQDVTNVLQRNPELVIVPIIDCLPIRLVASLLDLGMSVVVQISIRFTPVSDTSYPLREGMMCCEPYSRRTPSKIGQVGQKLVKFAKN